MLKEIIIAIQSYLQAHRFIVKHRLWKWILIPGLLYSILFCVGMYFFWQSTGQAIDYMLSVTGAKKWLVTMEESWLKFLVIFGQVILQLLLMLLYFSLFKYLFLIIGSPLFAYLSEKTEAIIEGKDFPFSFKQLFKDIVRGVRLALRNALWQTVYTVSILILSFIPLVGWFTPLIALLVECYYLGFSMLDYSCERNKLSTSQSIAFIGKHKGLAIGNGIVFYLMHLIIVVGWILAPSYAVIAATLSLYNAKKKLTMPSTVYLVPCVLDESATNTIPLYILDAVKDCQVIFAENERTARRFLKSICKEIVIDDYEWFAIHKVEEEQINSLIQKIKEDKNIAIISEAGCPGIADPGQILVEAAHQQNATIKPLVGPSSILLALMASGMNGQQFSFVGYLPIDNGERLKAIKELETNSEKKKSTQVFIETPYRNNQLLETLLKTCKASTKICIAAELTSPNEYVKTKTVADWRKEKTDFHKKPVIFLLQA